MTSEEIQAIFFAECEESLAAAEAGLAACQAGTHDDDTINSVFRAVHSVKGGAGAFGYVALQAYTHTFETLLSAVREGTVPIGDALVTLLLRALDTLADHVVAAREEGDAPDDALLLAELTAALGATQTAPEADAPVAAAPSAFAICDDEEDFSIDLDSLLDDIGNELAPPDEDGAPSASAGSLAPPTWTFRLRAHADAMANGSEPLLLLRELASLGATCVGCDIGAVPPIDEIDPCHGYLGWTFAVPGTVGEQAVMEIFDFAPDDWGLVVGEDAAMPPCRPEAKRAVQAAAPPSPPAPVQPAQAPAPIAAAPVPAETPAAAPAPSQSIRIDLAKLDRLIDTVGELVIAQAVLTQRLSGEAVAAAEELAQLEMLTREIQESAMAIRAQPISSVFSRVPRILRELAGSTGKHVKLEVSGEGTELDKTVIERLGEPLTHLIRNAVDHGIESAEDRLAAGKSAEGTLTLSAEHRSGRILIRIADDGRGIDRARVFAKAVEKGIVAADAQLSPEEIDNLIFAPGFSTAAVVTSVSGRGVGMDVVRQNVKDLGGRITIESEAGKGTAFTLALPLTLAISDGMIVKVGTQTLVLPLAHVVESLRPGDEDVHGLGSGRRMLNVRGRFIPILSVGDAIGAAAACDSPRDGVLIVVDTQVAGPAALLVDDICDQRQFVIKSLDTHYRTVDGVAGATILGDGRVALILDIDGLVSGALASSRLREAA